MALAHRLNQLALANSQGLLNDDEYRLLRHNLFEQHAGGERAPVETPLLPISTTTPPRHLSPSAVKTVPAQAQAPRPKPAVAQAVAGLLRKATGRSKPPPPPIHVSPAPSKPSLPGLQVASSPSPPPTPKRSALLPRILHKKPAPLLTHAPGEYHAIAYPPPTASPSSSNFSGSLISHSRSHSTSHSHSHSRSRADPAPLPAPVPPEPLRDVFDDDPLPASAAALRAAILATEDEARRLAAAFAALEASARRRRNSHRARRLPSRTPASVAVLLEGREWRTHRLPPSPSHARSQHFAPPPALADDAYSIRSAASGSAAATPALRTTFRVPPVSPTRAASASRAVSGPATSAGPAGTAGTSSGMGTGMGFAATLRRKASFSSVSSRAPSLAPSAVTGSWSGALPSASASASAPGTGSGSGSATRALARSMSHLGLRRLTRGTRGATATAASTEALPSTRAGAGVAVTDPHASPGSVRRRRERAGTTESRRFPYAEQSHTTWELDAPHHLDAYADEDAYRDGDGGLYREGTDDADADADADGGDADVELADIRARRAALAARYSARVEFLRAKLKGAELHERVMRR